MKGISMHSKMFGAAFALTFVTGFGALAQSYDPAPVIIQAPPRPTVASPSSRSSGQPQTPYSVANTYNDRELESVSGLDLGIQASYYEYNEPGLGVRLDGEKIGFNAIGTGTLPYGYFLTGDVRYALGSSDYKGSGTSTGNFEDLWDVRAYGGKDFIFAPFSVSPYLGLGYRYLYSDERGLSSTGAGGYRRENQLLYLPLGVKPRIEIDKDNRITMMAEYDVFLQGTQTTFLGDYNPGYPTLTNKQTGGFGVRGEMMWEAKSWSFGPFMSYWDINQSTTNCGTGPSVIACGDEPANHTFEGGLQFRYHLF